MLALLLIAVAVTAASAWTDYKTGQIPNWLTLGGILAGILGHLTLGWHAGDLKEGLTEGATAVAGMVLCSAAPLLMFWKGGMGGGDVKLFAAIGALCQPMLGIEAEMYGFVIAALLAPARMAYQGRLLAVLGNSLALLINPLRPIEKRREVSPEMMTWFRLGPAIFAGMLSTLVIHGYEFFPR